MAEGLLLGVGRGEESWTEVESPSRSGSSLPGFYSATEARAEHVHETKDKQETKRHRQPRLDQI